MTTVKHAKTLITGFLVASLFSINAFAADPNQNYDRGLEAKRKGEWSNALYYFKAIPEADERYESALNEIASVGKMQKAESEKKRREYDAKSLQSQLDKGMKRCEQLYADDSPAVHECVEALQKLVADIRSLMTEQYEHDGLSQLDGKLEEYRQFDELAMPVAKAKSTWNQVAIVGSDSTSPFATHITALESYVEDRKNPKELVLLGRYIVSSFHLGSMEGYRESCKILHKQGHGDTASAQEICGRVLDENKKFAQHKQALDANGGFDMRSIPSLAYARLQPMRELPAPESVNVDVPVSTGTNWEMYAAGGVAAAMAVIVPWLTFRKANAPNQNVAIALPLPVDNRYTRVSTLVDAWKDNTDGSLNTLKKAASAMGITVTSRQERGQGWILEATHSAMSVGRQDTEIQRIMQLITTARRQ